MSNTLLPCPFCGGEATISDGGYSGEKFLARCRELSCPAASGFIRKTHDEAIAAWNRRAEPENNPLTLDELKQMDGKPVWTVGVGANKCKSYYALVMLSRKSVYTVIGDEMVQVGALCQYGKTWLAYRSNPKEATNER